MSLIDVDDSDRLDGENPGRSRRFDVFLSYSCADGPVVRNVARRLREAGVTGGSPRILPPGALAGRLAAH